MANPNQQNPYFPRVELKGNPPIIITGGTSTAAANITIEVGTPGTGVGYGSVYICSSGGTMFIANSTGNTWFKVTAT